MEVRRFDRHDRRDSAISDDYDNDNYIVYENFIWNKRYSYRCF